MQRVHQRTVEIKYQTLFHAAKLARTESMGKPLESDQTDKLVVAEVVEMIDGGDEYLGFRNVLDGDGLFGVNRRGGQNGIRRRSEP